MKKIIYTLILLILIPAAFARLITILEQAVPISYCGYELEATYISDNEVRFRLDNETSKALGYHDLYEFGEGSRIYVREILEEEALEGPDMVSIRFYPARCTVEEEIMAEEEILEEIQEQENITKEELKPLEEPGIQEKTDSGLGEVPEEKPCLWTRIINWIKSLFSP
jgi:hypothetical protein